MRRKPKNVIFQKIDEQDENEENAPKKKPRILKKDPGPNKMPRLVHSILAIMVHFQLGGESCEPLERKMSVIAQTPNLRRFHVSPWTDLAQVVEYFQNRLVLEVHDHPARCSSIPTTARCAGASVRSSSVPTGTSWT